MSPKRLLALAGAFVGAGVLAYAALTRAGTTPIDAVPAGSFLVATVDVAGIRASALGAPLFEKDAAWGKLAELSTACGFDPATRLNELAFAVPEEGDRGDFGVAFSAEVSRAELTRCAESLAAQRGEAWSPTTIGHFRAFRVTSRVTNRVPSRGGDGEVRGHALAVRETGSPMLVLAGEEGWVRAMIDAADREAPSLRASREHTALRASLASHGRPLVLVTALLPSALRDRLKSEIGTELDVATASATADSRTRGILGVSAVGLAVRLASDGALEARAEARCETEGACAELRKFVLSMRLRWSQDLALRVVGLGQAIDALEATATGTSVTVTTRARADDLAAAIERVQKLRSPFKERTHVPPRPPPSIDEIVRPRASKQTDDAKAAPETPP